MDILGRHISN